MRQKPFKTNFKRQINDPYFTYTWIAPVYIHKSLKNVISGHNWISINETDYAFNDNFLILDLDKTKGKMSVIRLIHHDILQ